MLTRLYNWLFSSKKPSMTAENPIASDTTIAPTAADLLGAFQCQLKTKEAAFMKELEDWKKHRELEFSTAGQELQHLHTCDSVVQKKIKDIFSRLLHTIKRSLEPANLAIDDLMDGTQPHLNELRDHLNELCQALIKDEGNKKIRIDICDTSIIMLNELIVLMNDVSAHIEYCLKSEGITEVMVNSLLDIMAIIILGIPAPEFNVNLSSAYRDFLYREINEEKERLELCETELEGDLQKAEKLLERQPSVAANPSALFANKETTEPKEQTREDVPVLAAALK